jgi:hypothetical protein
MAHDSDIGGARHAGMRMDSKRRIWGHKTGFYLLTCGSNSPQKRGGFMNQDVPGDMQVELDMEIV